MKSASTLPFERAALVDAVDTMKALCVGPVVWGKSDCLMVAADALKPVIGIDIAARFRGKYGTPVQCADYLASLGFSSIAEAVGAEALRLGWEQIDPSEAQPGDAGVVSIRDVQGCAMLHRSGLWIARSVKGYAALPSRAVVCAFRISETAPAAGIIHDGRMRWGG
jgi:hypothetical protein